ncbi:MAG: hypothetical protein BSOLF_0239 [Candidatus Carbobacillus altaicus]|uniref:UPF0637 protein BSOLF_0239 n=1 Tax=Candidatus Carbonibacillus altaicus TaxID=2163959 RepID=A0A2R6Y158_9BACL|nr:MAG: hypothetical protein BSOLF_0239 [Candidatus Carbobacillus altaicus]
MSRVTLSQEAFEALTVPTLAGRMEAIEQHIRPIFRAFADKVAPLLSVWTQEEMFVHIAKHARRTVNPPQDTWVALAPDARGYKKHPHFQFGLWSTHAFFWLAVIYESPSKQAFAERLLAHLPEILTLIPETFVWSWNHMEKPYVVHRDLTPSDLEKALTHASRVKAAEVLIGRVLPKEEALKDDVDLVSLGEKTFHTLLPLYRLSRGHEDALTTYVDR